MISIGNNDGERNPYTFMVAGKGLLTADPHTLTVVKALVPSSDAGLFIMNANGTVGIEAGDGAIVSATVNAGEAVAFGEIAGTETNLANYSTTYVCDNGGPSGSTTSGIDHAFRRRHLQFRQCAWDTKPVGNGCRHRRWHGDERSGRYRLRGDLQRCLP